MIEICVRLVRGAVFFIGEDVECWISLRNIQANGVQNEHNRKVNGENRLVASGYKRTLCSFCFKR